MRGHHNDIGQQQARYGTDTPVNVGDLFAPRKFTTPIDRLSRRTAGKRSYTVTTRKRGRYIYARSAEGRYDDIALDATVRRAAPQQTRRDRGQRAVAIESETCSGKVRCANRPTGGVCVDASWSRPPPSAMEATNGAIMSLLWTSYQKRDRDCMISFQRYRANLVFTAHSSVQMAQSPARHPGGRQDGRLRGLMRPSVWSARHARTASGAPGHRTTDGAGNVSMTSAAREKGFRLRRLFAARSLRTVVINTEHASLDRGLAQELADNLAGPCLTLTDLRAESLYETVRHALNG
jgi:magnesium chelatase subunit D